MNFDWLARLLGYTVVWLIDHDGEVNKRWARQTPFGLKAERMGFGISPCLLLPDGSVRGACYVESWKPG